MAQTDIRTGITGFIQDGVELKDLYPLFPDCQAIELPFKRTSDNESLKLIPYNAADKWTTGSIPKFFIDESNPSQKFVERGTKPQFNKFYELISNEQTADRNYEIRKSDDYLKIVHIDPTNGEIESQITFTANDFKDKVIPQKILLFIQGAGASGDGGGVFNGRGDGGGSGAALSIIIDLPTYQTTVIYNGQWVPFMQYWNIYLGRGGIGTTSYSAAGEITYLTRKSYKRIGDMWPPLDPRTYVEIKVAGATISEGGPIELTDFYFNPLPGPENTYYFLVNYKEGDNTIVPYIWGKDGGDYEQRGEKYIEGEYSLATTNVLNDYNQDNNSINALHFVFPSGGYSSSDYGGGGAASVLARGGSGGRVLSGVALPGGDGTLGSGGGAGVKNGSEFSRGGNGGNAVVYFYY